MSTFGTYVLLKNTMTASTVFTSVALFNMLIGPLNAFPWVVNGMMEVLFFRLLFVFFLLIHHCFPSRSVLGLGVDEAAADLFSVTRYALG